MKIGKKTSKLADVFRVEHGKSFRLRDFDPADTKNLLAKDKATEFIDKHIVAMAELQDKLYAQDQWALLLIFQAMDAAGKDGVIKHVFSGVNPTGCEVTSFKQPSTEELDHDYLWRTTRRLPPRGKIGIFNRSYYEEVLVVRVHQDFLAKQHLPSKLVTKDIWKERFDDICNLESYLTRNGVVVRKFFLNVSRAEQRERFLARLEEPEKNWKFSEADVRERECWDDYMSAYEDMIRNTATPEAPWFVVPADHKWFMHAAVSAVIIETLKELKLSYPSVGPDRQKELASARKALEKKKD
ncbi:MAG TPA: polyphosphate kinase 2 family protein [Candidatus Angelobacter sp.]|nr:polyphosphate kinase 2 family protein [Candidatus Angelobacter sp.]